jgi:hypothetical protein
MIFNRFFDFQKRKSLINTYMRAKLLKIINPSPIGAFPPTITPPALGSPGGGGGPCDSKSFEDRTKIKIDKAMLVVFSCVLICN